MAATMADVAVAAHVSQGLAYRYFKDKDAIVHALVSEALEAGRADVRRITAMEGSPGTRLELLVTGMVDGRRMHPDLFALLHQLGDGSLPRSIRELVRRQGEFFRQALRQLITDGQSTGEVAGGDPDQLVMALLACLEGLSDLTVREPEAVGPHFPDVEILLRMFRPPALTRFRSGHRRGKS